jgi:hypothetical protein
VGRKAGRVILMMNLKIKLVTFYSNADESRLFEGLQSITAITDIKGVGRDLVMQLNVTILDDDMLRDLLALFMRYGISMYPLRELSRNVKFEWLNDTNAYWHQSMFN